MKRYKSLFESEDQTQTKEFKKWFGKSKVVKDGKPLVVYHGTTASFNKFSKEFLGKNVKNHTSKIGFYFTNSPDTAQNYVKQVPYLKRDTTQSIMPVYLSIQNPKILSVDDFFTDFKSSNYAIELKKQGYDGIIIKGQGQFAISKSWENDTLVVFEPNQIKSAIGNNGDFNPRSDNILEDVR